MKELIQHIEFLINQNNCVVVPGLGGFVLNYELAHIDAAGLFLPPRVVIGFNADLKHNDGLLCKSYSQYSSISYDAAGSKINYTVKQIKISLQKGKQLSIGKLGDILLSEGNIVFIPATDLVYPSVWGYSTLNLKQIEAIEEQPKVVLKSNKRVVLRRVLIGATSAAAALALFFIPMSSHSSLFSKVQQSGFFSGYTDNLARKIIDNKVISEDRTLVLDSFADDIRENREEFVDSPEAGEDVILSVVASTKISEVKVVKQQSVKTYYIIVGGDPHKGQANRLLQLVKANGFKNAHIVETADRYRIYVAAFADKTEANIYLDSFRQKNPSYADAWLFTKRN